MIAYFIFLLRKIPTLVEFSQIYSIAAAVQGLHVMSKRFLFCRKTITMKDISIVPNAIVFCSNFSCAVIFLSLRHQFVVKSVDSESETLIITCILILLPFWVECEDRNFTDANYLFIRIVLF